MGKFGATSLHTFYCNLPYAIVKDGRQYPSKIYPFQYYARGFGTGSGRLFSDGTEFFVCFTSHNNNTFLNENPTKIKVHSNVLEIRDDLGSIVENLAKADDIIETGNATHVTSKITNEMINIMKIIENLSMKPEKLTEKQILTECSTILSKI